ncbi:MAG: HAD-IA family hydrolase [Myxococcales bacterium]|nr:HAD-IA family hydrolase [Myxococcales bacterium]
MAPTVLFDLDGTLIDSIELIVRSHRHAHQELLGITPTREEILAHVGRPLLEVYADGGREQAEVDRLVACYRDYNLVHHDAMVQPYPGVGAMLEGLQALGVRLAIVTSKVSELARRGLECCGLSQHFEVIVGGDHVRCGKPAPEPVLLALERLGAEAKNALFVGDSIHDMHAGRAAGVRTAAALWGPFPREALQPAAPDYWLSEAAELIRITR